MAHKNVKGKRDPGSPTRDLQDREQLEGSGGGAKAGEKGQHGREGWGSLAEARRDPEGKPPDHSGWKSRGGMKTKLLQTFFFAQSSEKKNGEGFQRGQIKARFSVSVKASAVGQWALGGEGKLRVGRKPGVMVQEEEGVLERVGHLPLARREKAKECGEGHQGTHKAGVTDGHGGLMQGGDESLNEGGKVQSHCRRKWIRH